jgi:hypothetical protein
MFGMVVCEAGLFAMHVWHGCLRGRAVCDAGRHAGQHATSASTSRSNKRREAEDEAEHQVHRPACEGRSCSAQD